MRKNRPSRNAMLDQIMLGIEAQPYEAAVTAGSTLAKLTSGGQRIFFAEIAREGFADLLGVSSTKSKDVKDDKPVIEAFIDDMDARRWDDNGDALILHPALGILDGIKRCTAGSRARGVRRMLVAVVDDPEARFSIGDSRKSARASRGKRAAETAGAVPVRTAAIELRQVPVAARAAVGGVLEVRLRVGMSLEREVLTHWTAASVSESVQAVSRNRPAGVPVPLAAFVRSCLVDAAPLHTEGFMAAWADPSTAPGSAPARLATSPRRVNPDMEQLFLKACALASEAFVAGMEADPYDLLSSSRRVGWQQLQVLVGAGTGGPDPILRCSEESWEEAEIERVLEASGRPIASWSTEEINRIAPLVRDVARGKGLIVTGETVKITLSGVVVDGFDRLAACHLAGFPFRGFVVRGFRDGFSHERRQGRKQSPGHRLYAEGCPDPYDAQSVVGTLHCMTENDRGAVLTNTAWRRLQNQHPQVVHSISFVHDLQDLVPVSAMGAAHIALGRYSLTLANSFVIELFDVWKGEIKPTLPRQRTLALLVETLVQLKGKAFADQALCHVLEAMDAWCRDEEIRAFSPMPEVGYHKLGTPPQIREKERAAMADA